MNIGNKYLRSWLRFDESATKDFIADNQWQVYGNPTISTTNAISGKALQLDGNSFLKLPNIELGGRDFTIDCFAYINSTSPSNARLFSLINSSNSNYFITVRKSSSNSNRVNVWANSYADYSQNTGGNVDNTQTATNKRVHIAIVYKHTSSSPSYLYLCVDGYVQRLNPNMTMPPSYNRGTFNLFLGAQPDGTQGLIGSIDEFRIYDGVALFTSGSNFTPPDVASYNNFEFYPDIIRLAKTPATEWRYENIGEISTLINTQTAVQLDNLPRTQSRTGKAFYQTTQTKIFDVASSKEIWAKFDVYFDGVNRWRAYDGSYTTGITAQATNGHISFFNRSIIAYQSYNSAKINALQTVILHMIADSTSGLIEAYTDDGGLLYAYTGEVNNGTNFSNLYLQSDGAGTFFSNVVISNSPLWFDDNAITRINVDYLADIQREIIASASFLLDTERVVDKSWRYENYGTADLLTVEGNTVNNLPAEKSVIRSAFWQSGREGCFGIPATKELWAKWDLYYAGTAKWRVYDRKDSKDTGIARMNSTTSLVCYINGPLSVDVKPAGTITQGTRKTYLLHMVSDATDGYIELWIDGVKYYSDNFQLEGLLYKGNVNDGDYFSNFYMQSDNNTNLFSNVIISNRQIGLTENVWETIALDAERNIVHSALFAVDLVRQIVSSGFAETLIVDLIRDVSIANIFGFDAERNIVESVSLEVDCERTLGGIVNIYADAERKVGNYVDANFDREWETVRSILLDLDSEREVYATINYLADIFRKLLRKIIVPSYIPPAYDPNHDPSQSVFPPAENNGLIQSCTISLQEQQLTDDITFTYAANVNIMDDVNLQYLDYIIRGRVEETTTKGVIETCHLTCDIDEILYKQMAYKIPESKWEWTEEYLEYLRQQGGAIPSDADYDEAELKAIPSAPASAHISEIAAALGKGLSLQFDDYISTLNTEVSSGTNYAGLIEELFGWTSRIPQLMINCFMRDNTIYVIQRGHETNVVNLDGQKLSVHTTTKRLMRTTWGSTPWSKTEVKPYYNDWSEFDQAPYNPAGDEGGEATYGEDNLVEETTVEHGDETVVTSYTYLTLDDGRKFLSEEVAKTYSKGSLVDTVVTHHEPVSGTQAHVYAEDDYGILGGVVTPANHDDRITPYQSMVSLNGRNGRQGVIVHDGSGNSYLLYGIAHHSDKGEMKRRTINGVALIDTTFPVDGQSYLEALTQAVMWLDRKTEESVKVDLYDYPHVIDFNDRIIWQGNTYYLRSNTVTVNERIVNQQSLEFVRWY